MILAVSVLSFIRGLQSFNTELLLGTPAGIYVYSTKIYDFLHREPRAYGEATALGSVFLFVLAILLFFYWKFLSGNKKVHRRYRPRLFHAARQARQMALCRFGRLSALRHRHDAFAAGVSGASARSCAATAFSISLRHLPLNHWRNLLADPIFLVALKNSLIIASITAAGGILLYSALAYLMVSRRTITAPLLESLCWIPHVLPGISA